MILIVDYNRENIRSLIDILAPGNFRVDVANSGREAIEKIADTTYALVILNEQTEVTFGDEEAETISRYSMDKNIPVIFLTAVPKEKRSTKKDYGSGGVEYLAAPVDPKILLAKVEAYYTSYQRKDTIDRRPAKQQEKKYRYPGINSFETTDADIFYGREDDRKKSADLVEIEKTVLVYSRSGLGKSSLLKAALMPELTLRGYRPFYIRLGLYQENSLSPVQNIIRRTVLQELKQLPNTFLQKFINRTHSLWYVFKSLQVAHSENDRPVTLIFDQFEEIGSYGGQYLTEFKQQMAELLYTPIPKTYLEALKEEHLLSDPLTDAELDLLYKPLRVKAVFAIRSDQMSTLNALSDYLPNILKVYYALKPLSRKQALRAIVEPAKQEGEFHTPRFTYKEEALEKVLEALVSEKSDDIDTAQLQILLQYIEQDVVEKKGDTVISADDLGDLNKVYENYYRNSLDKLTAERKQAQELIEDKLTVGRRRISYDMDLCLQTVSEATLQTLVDTRLLRREPNTMGGYSYEISHDSLVAPILETREQRKRREQEEEKERLRREEEERKKVEYEAQLEEQRKKQRWQRLIITIVSAASVVSISLAVWAIVTQKEVRETLKEVERQKVQVESQKAETQKALNDFIEAEIARKSIEKEQLLRESKVYRASNDRELEREAQSRADALEKQIEDLRKKMEK